ncbi:DUF5994 family protein [Streptomyces sp. N35]|uniref:DUF5994 family protein n=1 Tax=Streptomyces sp. N35 TaxID=2795730 RepID=UPI0018F74435|nr:DUF5994 family protein [Streptomyces sp. N35]
MTATATSLRITPPPSPSGARVELKSPTGQGLLDGAWWPRSRDLTAELPALAEVLDPLWGRVTRVAVNPMLWPVVPRKVPLGHRVLNVGWFAAELDPHKLLLLGYGTGRWDLLVIPPETDAATAARLMSAACAVDGPALTATDLVAAALAGHDVAVQDRPQSAQESWEYEGGATSMHAVPRAAGR